MQQQIVHALMQECYANIEIAKMNVLVFIGHPVGVGDHPNVMETIKGQLDIISQNKDRLSVLTEYFNE